MGRFEGGGRSPRARYPKLHIEPEQFEGSKTFTNFTEPLFPKKRTEQPCLYIWFWPTLRKPGTAKRCYALSRPHHAEVPVVLFSQTRPSFYAFSNNLITQRSVLSSHTCPSHTLVLLTHQDGWLPVSLQQEAQPHIAVEMVVHLIPDHDPFPVGRHDLPLGGRLGFLEQLLLCKEQIDELHLHTHTHTHRIMHTHWCYRVKNRLMSSTCTHTHAHTRAHTHIHTQNHVHTYAIVWKKINKLHLHTNTHKHTQIHAHTKMHGKVVCHNHGIREGCSQLTVQPIAQPTTHSSLQLSNRCLRFLVRKLKCQHPYSKLVRLLCFRFSGHEKRMERYGTSSMWPFACGNPAVPPNLVLTHF